MLYRLALLAALAAPPALAQALPADAPAPCAAYLDAFDIGLVSYRAGAYDLARQAWAEAAAVATCGPDAAYNLAILASETGDLRAAAARYAETLDRLAGWDVPEGARDGVRAMRQLALAGLFNVGAIQLERDSLATADATLAAVLARDPLYRDALYNRAVGLRRAERWRDLKPAAEHLLGFDPLSRTAHTLRFEALRALRDRRGAARVARTLAALPVDVERLDIRMDGAVAEVTGTVEGGAAAPGTPMRLALTLLSPDGPLATQTVAFAAPARGARARFTATFPGATGATAYRYERLGN